MSMEEEDGGGTHEGMLVGVKSALFFKEDCCRKSDCRYAGVNLWSNVKFSNNDFSHNNVNFSLYLLTFRHCTSDVL